MNKLSLHIIAFSITAGVIFAGCAIRLPKITATGERTVFENQIVGSYRMIEEEAWMAASLRAEGQSDSIAISQEKQIVLEAILRQRFNADDVDDFKKLGIAGEKSDGLLSIRDEAFATADSALQALAQKVISEEIEDRKLIMNRLIELHPEIDASEKSKIGMVYAKLKQETSPSGTWIQEANGGWVKK